MVTASVSITNNDRPVIKSAVGPENKIFAAAAGRLYFARKNEKKWTLLHEAGGITFYQSLDSGILYFCLIDLNKKQGIQSWEQELYVDFKYHMDSEVFHSFESDEGMIGFLFASSEDAAIFHEAVSEQLELTTTHKSTEKKKKSRSIFSVFKFTSSKKKERKGEAKNTTTPPPAKKKNDDLTHEDVSEPRDFRHLSHIGFNPEKGTFDVKNIPEDWKQLFDKAGITQEQLENKETANFIAGFVDKSEVMMKRAAPPVKKKVAPPPPPTLKNKAASPKKSAPAPPPKKGSRPTSAILPPPPPPPPSKPPSMAANGHSELMQSIKYAGTQSLKPVDTESLSDRPPLQNDNPHSSLMAAIRSGQTLKKAPSRSETRVESPAESTNGNPSEMMAAMLAKALAARNKKLSMESEDDSEESDDSRW